MYAFVVPMDGAAPGPALRAEIAGVVRSQIGAFAAPDVIQW